MTAAPLGNQNTPGASTTDIGQPGTQPGQGGGSGDFGALTNSVVSQIQSIQQSLVGPNTPADATAVYAQGLQSILGMLNDQEASLRSEFQKQGTQIDPATQFTLDQLRQNLTDNLASTKSDLNRRGLLESGIELSLESNLRSGNASNEAQILSTRLSKLQSDLNAGLTSLGSQRVSTASSYGLAAANAQQSTDQQTRQLTYDREQASLQAMLNLRGQMSTAQTAQQGNTAAMQRALLNEQGANSRQAATLAQNQYEFGNLSAAQQNANQEAALGRAATAARAGTVAATKAATPAAQTAATISAATDAINQDYQTREDAIQAVQARASSIVAQVGTAGYQKILNHAGSLPSGRQGSTY